MIPKPVYYDLWGYPVDWTDLGDGWDQTKRDDLMRMMNQIITQSPSLENYTEIGYIKTKIPTQLYQDILNQRQIQNLMFERCDPYHAISNCKEIRKNVWLFYLSWVS